MHHDRICSRSFGQVYPQLRMVPRVLMRYWGGKLHRVLCTVTQGSHRESVYEDKVLRPDATVKIPNLIVWSQKGENSSPSICDWENKDVSYSMSSPWQAVVKGTSERVIEIIRSIHFGSKDRSHNLVYQPLRITLSLCVCGFSPRSLKTIPCGETIYQAFCLYTSSLLRCHRASPPYSIVPPSSSFSSSLQPPLTACLIVFVCVHCILNALSWELTICAVESQTDYFPCLESQYITTTICAHIVTITWT